ncbi:MAG: hypothetical protein WEA99_02205 [Brumimicrobium sp.]
MKIRSLDDLELLASEREGDCLSKEFTDPMLDHAWRCKKGHTFDMSPFLVSRGAWCNQCNKRKTPEQHLQWLKEYAVEKGGKCLSTEFINRKTRVKFECAEGHQWEVLPTIIFYEQTWCKKCAGLAKLGLDDMKKLALEKGGVCLSKSFKGRYSKLLWKCANGHTFKQTQKAVKRGMWCLECKTNEERSKSLELMKTWAKKREGKCLSTTYISNEDPLIWECKNGHQFKKSRDYIKQLTADNWCAKCTSLERKRKREIEILKKMHQYAAKKNGKFLSDAYNDLDTALKFECSKGHVWETRAHHIFYSQTWCPECNMERLQTRGIKSRIKSFELMKKWAKERGGKFLSSTYVSKDALLEWECKNGHQFKKSRARVRDLSADNWCSKCNTIERDRKREIKALKKIHHYATKKNGKCLTNTYQNNNSVMKFECAKGHVWEVKAQSILYSQTWCPDCYLERVRNQGND